MTANRLAHPSATIQPVDRRGIRVGIVRTLVALVARQVAATAFRIADGGQLGPGPGIDVSRHTGGRV